MGLLTAIIANSGGAGTSGGGGGGGTISNIKNIQLLPKGAGLGIHDYRAFGGQLFYIPSLNIVRNPFRAGTGHLTGGIIPYQDLDVTTRDWASEIVLETNTYNLEDCACGLMDNDTIVVFYTCSDNGFNGNNDHTQKCYYIKYDLNMNPLTGRIDLIGGTSSIAALDRGWAFDSMQSYGTPGHYSIAITQYNTDTAPTSDSRMSIVKTTDYWATFTVSVFCTDATMPANECTHVVWPSGKIMAFARRFGGWQMFTANSFGSSWTNRGQCSLSYYNFNVKIYSICMHGTSRELMDIIYQDRDAGMILISKNNTESAVMDSLLFNPPEVIAYSATGDVSLYNGLGYPRMCYITPTLALYIFSKETQGDAGGDSPGIADYYWSVDDLVTDPDGAPVAPATLTDSLFAGTTTSTTFRVDITGYTLKQIENIKYWLCDLSTDNFSTFETVQYQNTDGTHLIHDIRIPALFVSFFGLTPATTYQFRIKAVNNTGSSIYKTISVTTL